MVTAFHHLESVPGHGLVFLHAYDEVFLPRHSDFPLMFLVLVLVSVFTCVHPVRLLETSS
jgi:hypothetical protein